MKETGNGKYLIKSLKIKSSGCQVIFTFEEEEHDVLHEAVKQLDEKYRIPIILFYFHDQSYEEIAIILKSNYHQ